MRSPSELALWPREHGAWMQLLFPLLTVGLLASSFGRWALFPVASLALFTAHEPALILAGRRGERAREALASRARLRLGLLVTIGVAAGAVSLYGAPWLAWELCAIPAALGAITTLLALRGWERNVLGELNAALALSSLALPAGTLAGLALESVLLCAGAWAVSFTLATVIARSILIRKKDSGRGLLIAVTLAILVLAASGVALGLGALDPRVAAGPTAFAIVSIVLAIVPPSPKHMTRLGFGLTGACLVTIGSLVWALRG